MKASVRILSFLLVIVVLALPLCSCTKKNYDANDLIAAIEKNDIEEVKRLLEQGVDPNVPNAPESNFLNFIRSRLESDAPKYPLSVACGKANYEIVKLLIDHGATTDFSNKSDWSPLMSALFLYHPDTLRIVDLLLENGADVYYREGGRYPIEEATRMSPLKYEGKSKTGIYDEEKANGITEVVKLLLARMEGYDINESTRTLLMNAAISGNIALSRYLLSIGADKSKVDSTGKTAYDYAMDNGHYELAELLKP